jgi:hypothetical protein
MELLTKSPVGGWNHQQGFLTSGRSQKSGIGTLFHSEPVARRRQGQNEVFEMQLEWASFSCSSAGSSKKGGRYGVLHSRCGREVVPRLSVTRTTTSVRAAIRLLGIRYQGWNVARRSRRMAQFDTAVSNLGAFVSDAPYEFEINTHLAKYPFHPGSTSW